MSGMAGARSEQAGPGEAGGLRARLVERLLGLVERSVGRGERLPEAEWEALRGLASGHARSLELVARLEAIVADCVREIDARLASGEDVGSLRADIVAFVREKVAPAPLP